MQLKLSDKWYAREFGKEDTEPALSITAGRSDLETNTEEERTIQVEDALTHQAALPSALLPMSNSVGKRR